MQSRTSEGQQAIVDRCFHPHSDWEPFTWDEIEQSIPQRFAQIAARFPDQIALKWHETTWTYRELDQITSHIAAILIAETGAAPGPVGLLFNQSDQPIIALLAALKAGKFYLPLEPLHPLAHNRQLVDETAPHALLTVTQHLAEATQLARPDCLVFCVDGFTRHPNYSRGRSVPAPDALASIHFTSGSTGSPKGVVNDHRTLLHVNYLFSETFHICTRDRVALSNRWGAGGGATNIFPALLSGASLIVYDMDEAGVNDLAHWLAEEAITIFTATPTVFRIVAHALSQGVEVPNLRVLGLSGEPVLESDIKRFQQLFPANCRLRIGYGTTEALYAAAFFIEKDAPLVAGQTPAGFAAG